MTETWLGTIPVFSMLILIAACFMYMWGGRSGKWKRRFIGSCLCSCSIWCMFILMHRWSWHLLWIYPLTIGAFSLGYGAHTPETKVARRFTVVAASLVTGLLLVFLVGGGSAWYIFTIEALVASMTVILGVTNPIQAAPEEFFVCFLLWIPKLMYGMV